MSIPRLSGPNRALVVATLSTSLLATNCAEGSNAEPMTDFDESHVAAPNPLDQTAGLESEPADEECAEIALGRPVINLSGVTYSDPETDGPPPPKSLETIVEEIEKQSIERPTDIINYFITESGLDEQVDFKLGASYTTNDEIWNPAAPETEQQRLSTEQITRLLSATSAVINEVSSYPPGLLSALGVNYLTFDIDNQRGGLRAHFYSENGNLEFVLSDIDETDLQANFAALIAHEVGHAIHEVYCDAYEDLDIELVGDLGLEVGTGPTLPGDEHAFWAEKDPEEYTYGPNRKYPRAYGTIEEEYFANIIAFTTHERGLILPGDLDYGSILQQNQEIIVNFVDTHIVAGFREHVENRTALLRQLPSNEINQTN